MSLALTIVLAIIIFMIMKNTIMIVPEGTVVAAFVFGKFSKFYGSGLHVGWFDGAVVRRVTLKVGDIVSVPSSGTIEIKGHQIPAKFSDAVKVGASGRIEALDGAEPIITQRDVPNERTVTCEKCHHVMKVRV